MEYRYSREFKENHKSYIDLIEIVGEPDNFSGHLLQLIIEGISTMLFEKNLIGIQLMHFSPCTASGRVGLTSRPPSMALLSCNADPSNPTSPSICP